MNYNRVVMQEAAARLNRIADCWKDLIEYDQALAEDDENDDEIFGIIAEIEEELEETMDILVVRMKFQITDLTTDLWAGEDVLKDAAGHEAMVIEEMLEETWNERKACEDYLEAVAPRIVD